jgi:hypothetical protein
MQAAVLPKGPSITTAARWTLDGSRSTSCSTAEAVNEGVDAIQEKRGAVAGRPDQDDRYDKHLESYSIGAVFSRPPDG